MLINRFYDELNRYYSVFIPLVTNREDFSNYLSLILEVYYAIFSKLMNSRAFFIFFIFSIFYLFFDLFFIFYLFFDIFDIFFDIFGLFLVFFDRFVLILIVKISIVC